MHLLSSHGPPMCSPISSAEIFSSKHMLPGNYFNLFICIIQQLPFGCVCRLALRQTQSSNSYTKLPTHARYHVVHQPSAMSFQWHWIVKHNLRLGKNVRICVRFCRWQHLWVMYSSPLYVITIRELPASNCVSKETSGGKLDPQLNARESSTQLPHS